MALPFDPLGVAGSSKLGVGGFNGWIISLDTGTLIFSIGVVWLIWANTMKQDGTVIICF